MNFNSYLTIHVKISSQWAIDPHLRAKMTIFPEEKNIEILPRYVILRSKYDESLVKERIQCFKKDTAKESTHSREQLYLSTTKN